MGGSGLALSMTCLKRTCHLPYPPRHFSRSPPAAQCLPTFPLAFLSFFFTCAFPKATKLGGFLCQARPANSKLAAATPVQTCSWVLNARANDCATAATSAGVKVSIVLMDWRRLRICEGVRISRRSALRWRLRIMVARARPMLPPRRRACDWRPWDDAREEGG